MRNPDEEIRALDRACQDDPAACERLARELWRRGDLHGLLDLADRTSDYSLAWSVVNFMGQPHNFPMLWHELGPEERELRQRAHAVEHAVYDRLQAARGKPKRWRVEVSPVTGRTEIAAEYENPDTELQGLRRRAAEGDWSALRRLIREVQRRGDLESYSVLYALMYRDLAWDVTTTPPDDAWREIRMDMHREASEAFRPWWYSLSHEDRLRFTAAPNPGEETPDARLRALERASKADPSDTQAELAYLVELDRHDGEAREFDRKLGHLLDRTRLAHHLGGLATRLGRPVVSHVVSAAFRNGRLGPKGTRSAQRWPVTRNLAPTDELYVHEPAAGGRPIRSWWTAWRPRAVVVTAIVEPGVALTLGVLSILPSFFWGHPSLDPFGRCQNCQAVFRESQLREPARLWERVDQEAGEDPMGECPTCGALVYLDEAQPDEGGWSAWAAASHPDRIRVPVDVAWRWLRLYESGLL